MIMFFSLRLLIATVPWWVIAMLYILERISEKYEVYVRTCDLFRSETLPANATQAYEVAFRNGQHMFGATTKCFNAMYARPTVVL